MYRDELEHSDEEQYMKQMKLILTYIRNDSGKSLMHWQKHFPMYSLLWQHIHRLLYLHVKMQILSA